MYLFLSGVEREVANVECLCILERVVINDLSRRFTVGISIVVGTAFLVLILFDC